jgi:hypothetical protein
MMKTKHEWTKHWPSEIGAYWFYGWTSRISLRMSGKPRMEFVKVRQGSNALMVTTAAQFLYKSECVGVWCKADVPEPPACLSELLRNRE